MKDEFANPNARAPREIKWGPDGWENAPGCVVGIVTLGLAYFTGRVGGSGLHGLVQEQ